MSRWMATDYLSIIPSEITRSGQGRRTLYYETIKGYTSVKIDLTWQFWCEGGCDGFRALALEEDTGNLYCADCNRFSGLREGFYMVPLYDPSVMEQGTYFSHVALPKMMAED